MLRVPVLVLVLVTTMTRSGESNGIGRRTTALTTLKIAVVAPMPEGERQDRRGGEAGLAEQGPNAVTHVLQQVVHAVVGRFGTGKVYE